MKVPKTGGEAYDYKKYLSSNKDPAPKTGVPKTSISSSNPLSPPTSPSPQPSQRPPPPDWMNRAHNKRRTRFMEHTSTLKTFSEKDDELERRTPKSLPKLINIDSFTFEPPSPISVHTSIILVGLLIQVLIAGMHCLVFLGVKRTIDNTAYMDLFSSSSENPQSLEPLFSNCTYFSGPHLLNSKVFLDYDISVYSSELFFPFSLAFHLMIMMSRPREKLSWREGTSTLLLVVSRVFLMLNNNMESPHVYYVAYSVSVFAVVAVTFVMVKVRRRMRMLDHKKLSNLVFNILPKTMISLIAALAFLNSESLGCLMRYSCLDIRLCEDKIYSGATFCYLFYTFAFLSIFTLPLRREYGLQNLMRFDFAHFIEQFEFYALWVAGLIGMFAFASCNDINDYEKYYDQAGPHARSLDQNFWFRGLLYYSSSLLLLFVILFSWFDISHLHIQINEPVHTKLEALKQGMKSMKSMKRLTSVKSTRSFQRSSSSSVAMASLDEGDDGDEDDDGAVDLSNPVPSPPASPPPPKKTLNRSSSSRLRSSFTGQEDFWFGHKVKEGPKKGASYFHQPSTGTTTWTRPKKVIVKCGVTVKKYLIPAAPEQEREVAPRSQSEMSSLTSVDYSLTWSHRIRHYFMTHQRGRWAPIHRLVMLLFSFVFLAPTFYFCFYYMPRNSLDELEGDQLPRRQAKLRDAYDVVSFTSVLLTGSTCMYCVTHPYKTFDLRKNWGGFMFFLPTVSFYTLAYFNFGIDYGYDNMASVIANILAGTLWLVFYKRYRSFIKAVRMLNVQAVDAYLASVARYFSAFMVPACYLTSESIGCFVSGESGMCTRLLRCNYGIVVHLVLAFIFECICTVHHKPLNISTFLSYYEDYPFGLQRETTSNYGDYEDPTVHLVEKIRLVIPVMWVGLITFEVMKQHNFIIDIEHYSEYVDDRISEPEENFSPIKHGTLYYLSHHLFEGLDAFMRFTFSRFIVPKDSPRISNIFSFFIIALILACFLNTLIGWTYALNHLGTGLIALTTIKFGLLLSNLFITFFIMLLLFTDLEPFDLKKAAKRRCEAISMHHLRKYILPSIPTISAVLQMCFINSDNVIKIEYSDDLPGGSRQNKGDRLPWNSDVKVLGLYEYGLIPIVTFVVAITLINWRKRLIRAFPSDILKSHILTVVVPTLLAVVPTIIYMATEYLACNIRLNDIYRQDLNNYSQERPAYIVLNQTRIGKEGDFIYTEIACGRLFYSIAPVMYLVVVCASCSFIRVGSYSTNINFEKLLTLKGVSIMDGIQMVMLCILGLFAIMMYGTRRLGESVAFQRLGWGFVFVPLLIVYVCIEAVNANRILKIAQAEREMQEEEEEEDDFEKGIRDSYAKDYSSSVRMSSRVSSSSGLRRSDGTEGGFNIELRKTHTDVSIWDGGSKGAFKARKSKMGWANGEGGKWEGEGGGLGGEEGEGQLKGEGVLLQLNPGMI
ncbi:hypothetical protein TrST_g6924 [Triparma strigata]|uniref:WW domain-containing protein n=1 Tax=Triparma strigata TaxID=1606541 RepID=A0A9W7BC50_9STRA|nr:hypothetical protein TrST_g6924 [Triparma strigata]